MALTKSYLTSAKNLKDILTAIQTAKSPERFSQKFLESLEFKSSSDRLIVGVLKGLGFLDENGAPTPRYHRFLDQTQAGRVLAEGIEEAYDELFRIRKDAYKLERGEVKNKLRTLTEGKIGDAVLDKMAMTFAALCELADWDARPAATETQPTKEKDATREAEVPKTHAKPSGAPSLHYNIEIHLPESRDPAVYDALFKSLREHLYR